MITTIDGKSRKRLEDELYLVGLVFLVLSAAAVPVMQLFVFPYMDSLPIGCVLWTFLGIYCPGCGGTRAVRFLLSGHLLKSFLYHPLVPYCVALYAVFMITWTLAKLHLFGVKEGLKFRVGYFYGMLVIIAVNFILKNVLKFGFGIVMI